MVRPLRPRSVVGALVASAVATVLISACGDQVPPQAKEHTGAEGIDLTVHDIAIRNAHITLNGDGTGELSVVLFNKSTQADSLTSVAPGNSKTFSRAILPTRDEIGAVGNIAASATAFPNGTVSTSISFGPSFTPSAPASAAGASSVDLPASSGVFLNDPPAQITLTGFPAGTLVGAYAPTTFTFATAGTVTFQIPVVSGSDVTTSASQTNTPSVSATAVPHTTSPGTTTSARSTTGAATPTGSPQSTPATASSPAG